MCLRLTASAGLSGWRHSVCCGDRREHMLPSEQMKGRGVSGRARQERG